LTTVPDGYTDFSGHGDVLTLHSAVDSASAEETPMSAIAVTAATKVRPNIFIGFTGSTSFPGVTAGVDWGHPAS
jgi:hypothetical protein